MRAPQAANVSNPTVVEGLQGKYIVAIACGCNSRLRSRSEGVAGTTLQVRPRACNTSCMVCELNAHRSAY